MTLDQVAEIGKNLLVEYEGRLAVDGIKPFDRFLAENIAQRVDGNLDNIRPDVITMAISSVLERMAAKGGFVMSEPEFTEPMKGADVRNVAYKDLRLTFTYGGSAVPVVTSYLWISAWVYPKPTTT